MKRITIGGKEYTFKFSVAASLYDDCTKALLNGFVTGGRVEEATRQSDIEGVIDGTLSTFANIPQKAITMFYAGLLEYHGDEIKSLKDARELIREYLEENKDEEGNWSISFFDVLQEMMTIMAEDNFFALIGLGKMIDQAFPTEEEPQKTETLKKRGRKKSQVGNN